MRGLRNIRREMLAKEKKCMVCGDAEQQLDVAPIVLPALLSNKLVKKNFIVVCPKCVIDIRPTSMGRPDGKHNVDDLFALNSTTYEAVKTSAGDLRDDKTNIIMVSRELHKKRPKDVPPHPSKDPK